MLIKNTRFVSFTKASEETEFYQVKFEKLPTFCYMCGMLGHWHEECGTGEHVKGEMEWGEFILATLRDRGGRGRGSGHGAGRTMGRGWNNQDGFDDSSDLAGRGRGRFAGRGRGQDMGGTAQRENQEGFSNELANLNPNVSWSFNAINSVTEPIGPPENPINGGVVVASSCSHDVLMGDSNILGKRSAEDKALAVVTPVETEA